MITQDKDWMRAQLDKLQKEFHLPEAEASSSGSNDSQRDDNGMQTIESHPEPFQMIAEIRRRHHEEYIDDLGDEEKHIRR